MTEYGRQCSLDIFDIHGRAKYIVEKGEIMKILHICLANFYIDNFSYQENILPRMHKKLGYEVQILASTETFIDKSKIGYIYPKKYINEDGILVDRVAYSPWFPRKLVHKLRIYPNVYSKLEEFLPDTIFIHGTQFLSILSAAKYAKKHPQVKIYADGHADYINSARCFISKQFLYKIIYRYCARKILPYTKKFYGTLPARNDFIHEMYGVPKEKIQLLPMGADDDKISEVKSNGSKDRIRKLLGLSDEDFLIVTGGKYNLWKKDVLNLLDAVASCERNVHLLFFGSIAEDLKEEFDKKVKNDRIHFVGWANELQSYEYLNASDLAVYPCFHSTLWEQSVGLGIPCIFHKLDGFTHIDMGNNCILLENCGIDELVTAIDYARKNIKQLKLGAAQAAQHFSYWDIAKTAIEYNVNNG